MHYTRSWSNAWKAFDRASVAAGPAQDGGAGFSMKSFHPKAGAQRFYQDYSTAKKKEQNGIAATGRPSRKSKTDHFPGNAKRQGNALGNIHKKPEWILEEVGENLPEVGKNRAETGENCQNKPKNKIFLRFLCKYAVAYKMQREGKRSFVQGG